MEWINFNQQKPTDDQTVLGCQKGQTGYPILCYYDEEIDAFIPCASFQDFYIKIDYWMPLPTLPDQTVPYTEDMF